MGLHLLSVLASLVMISVRLDVPQSGVQISLTLYRIEQGAYWETPAGSCETDAQGQCELQVTRIIRGRDGFLRGYLSANEIKRAVIWPGGRVEVVMSLNEPPHDNPYDYLSTQDHPIQIQPPAQQISWIPAVLAVLAGMATFAAYRAAKKQKVG